MIKKAEENTSDILLRNLKKNLARKLAFKLAFKAWPTHHFLEYLSDADKIGVNVVRDIEEIVYADSENLLEHAAVEDFFLYVAEIFESESDRNLDIANYIIDRNFFSDVEDEEWQEYIGDFPRDVARISDPEIVDLRLKFYASKILEIESEKANKQKHIKFLRRQELGKYFSAEEKYKADMNRYTIDFEEGRVSEDERPISPELPAIPRLGATYNYEQYYLTYCKEFMDILNPMNLLNIVSGFNLRNLSGFINQIVEYRPEIIGFEYDNIWEYVAEKIMEDEDICASLDSDLLNFILYSAPTIVSDEELAVLLNSGSLARDYDAERLMRGGFILESLRIFLSEINVEKLREKIVQEFAYVKEMVESGQLREFCNQYNAAYRRNDLVEQNQLWSVFNLMQNKLRAIKEEDRPDIGEALEEAKKLYIQRAKEYYFRIYPQHTTSKLIYSAKNPEKVAAIDMSELLGELETVGREIQQSLRDTTENQEDATNILCPILCFVVTDQEHKKGGNHKRIIVPISFNFSEYENDLLSRDIDDEVFDEETAKEFYELAKKDSRDGISIIKQHTTPNVPQDPDKIESDKLPATFEHSERVFFQALKQKKNVKEVVGLLQQELERISGKELEGKYKVYSVALLTYSSHGICQYCSPAIIAHENHLQDKFLTSLTKELNSSEHFKTRGNKGRGSYEKRQDRIRRNFHLSTIVTCDDTHSEQSIDMNSKDLTVAHSAKRKFDEKYHNPQAKICLDSDAIDLHKHEASKTRKGLARTNQTSFYEFIGARFSDRESAAEDKDEEFTFKGKVFMSGSKMGKLDNPALIDTLNSKAKTIISARSVIKIASGKGKERDS